MNLFSHKISRVGMTASLLMSTFAHAQGQTHFFQIKINVSTAVLKAAGIISDMDANPDTVMRTPNLTVLNLPASDTLGNYVEGIAHAGDLTFFIKDKTTGETIEKIPMDSPLPTLNFSKVIASKYDYLNVEVVLNDNDYEMINPYSWFTDKNGIGKTDDQTTILSLSIAPNQVSAINSFAYSTSQITKIVSNSENQIQLTTQSSDGKSVESRVLSSVTEVQTALSEQSNIGYSAQILKIR